MGDTELCNSVPLVDGFQWLAFVIEPSSITLADSGEPAKLAVELLEDTPTETIRIISFAIFEGRIKQGKSHTIFWHQSVILTVSLVADTLLNNSNRANKQLKITFLDLYCKGKPKFQIKRNLTRYLGKETNITKHAIHMLEQGGNVVYENIQFSIQVWKTPIIYNTQ